MESLIMHLVKMDIVDCICIISYSFVVSHKNLFKIILQPDKHVHIPVHILILHCTPITLRGINKQIRKPFVSPNSPKKKNEII